MPLSEKAIVCACEDVSVHDVDDAIAHGFADIESLKRYTGLGTGPCEGKECMAPAARLCLMALQQDAETRAAAKSGPPTEARVEPFTSRPPVQPAPLGIFARGDEES